MTLNKSPPRETWAVMWPVRGQLVPSPENTEDGTVAAENKFKRKEAIQWQTP